MSDEELKKLHELELFILQEFKRVCNKNNIDYFLTAGTLLGAVRHKGFIPWDDDLDVAMSRKNYEKFMECAKKDLKKEFFLQNWDTDANFALPFSKLRLNDTIFVEKNSNDVDIHKGIFIDIFPFDNIPKSKIKRKVQDIKTYVLKRLILAKLGYVVWEQEEKFKKIVYGILIKIAKLFSIERLRGKLNKQILKYNHKDCKNATNFSSAYGYKKATIEKKWIEELEEKEFENYKFLVPKMYDNYLTGLYGDYMTPPPEEKRYNRHKVQKLYFGEY